MLLSYIFVRGRTAPGQFMIADVSWIKMRCFPSRTIPQLSTQPLRKHAGSKSRLKELQSQQEQ